MHLSNAFPRHLLKILNIPFLPRYNLPIRTEHVHGHTAEYTKTGILAMEHQLGLAIAYIH